MYKCENCGHLFEDGEQATWVEPHGEKLSGCPICKESYAEIKPCKICGSYEHDFAEEYCNECKADVQKRFKSFILSEFTEEEREFLKELCKEGLL